MDRYVGKQIGNYPLTVITVASRIRASGPRRWRFSERMV